MIGDDVDRIMAVMARAFDPGYGEAWSRGQVMSALLVGSCHYLLIGRHGDEPEDGASAAGFALLRTSLDEEELLLIAVDPETRGRGLGTKLLRRAMASARARGVARMMLEMRRGNSAERLYLAHGFSAVGCRLNYYRAGGGERIDAITFACSLA